MANEKQSGRVQARRMGSGLLLRDGRERVMLVQPSYKKHWEIPGGAIEPGESPRACCRREILEELRLKLPVGRLLVTDWLPPAPPVPDGWMFVYDGGILSSADASRIVLPPELLSWDWIGVHQLEDFLQDFMARRIRIAHRCSVDGTSDDLESGFSSHVTP